MRSFTIALIATALATFTSAAPTGGLPGVGGSSLGLDPLSVVTSGISEVAGAAGGASSLPGAVRTRDDTSSVTAIFEELTTQIQPFTLQLTSIDSSNATVEVITEVVASIKASIDIAVPRLEALVGADTSVILAGTDGTTLTVADVAAFVGADVRLILDAAGTVLVVVKADTEVVVDVEAVLADLGAAVTVLVEDVVKLVADLTVALTAEVEPVKEVILELHLDALAELTGIEA